MPVRSGGGVNNVGVKGLPPPQLTGIELNDRHLRLHGKIGDCEQSRLRAARESMVNNKT